MKQWVERGKSVLVCHLLLIQRPSCNIVWYYCSSLSSGTLTCSFPTGYFAGYVHCFCEARSGLQFVTKLVTRYTQLGLQSFSEQEEECCQEKANT